MNTQPQDIQDIYALSPLQEGMLFHSMQQPHEAAYIVQFVSEITGPIQTDVFDRAWQAVVDHHVMLRTAFFWEETEQPVQVVHTHAHVWVRHVDAQGNQEMSLEAILAQDRATGFEMACPPLMRLALVHTGADQHTLVMTIHHALLDGWSFPILIGDFLRAYHAIKIAETPVLPSYTPFGDYVEWMQHQTHDRAQLFWREYLAELQPLPSFESVCAAVAMPGQATAQVDLSAALPEATTAALQAFAKQTRLTLNTVVQAAWALVLSRYTQQHDVVFGVVVSGRSISMPGIEGVIGPLVNTLPLRVRIRPEVRLKDWLREVQDSYLSIQPYEGVPLVNIHGWSGAPRNTLLFESILAFENYPMPNHLGAQCLDLSFGPLRSIERTEFPVTLAVLPGVGHMGLTLRLIGDTKWLPEAAYRGLLKHLETALLQMAQCPDAQVRDITVMPKAEQDALLTQFNDTHRGWPYEQADMQTLDVLFAQAVQRTPHAIAVVAGDQLITYSQLDADAQRVAAALAQQGVRSTDVVAFCLEQAAQLIIGMLAIVKLGATYLPLDPSQPDERLASMLQDSTCRWVLTHRHWQGRLHGPTPLVCLDVSEMLAQTSAGAACPSSGVVATSAAYVMYTSGSTGKPKGISVPHRAVAALVLQTNYIDLAAETTTQTRQLTQQYRVAQASNVAFDAATFEVWGALLNGAQLCLLPKPVLIAPHELAQHLIWQAVDVLFITTALFNQIAQICPSAFAHASHVLFGGEAVNMGAVRRVVQSGKPAHLLHVYGPTEVTTFALWHEVSEADMATHAQTLAMGAPLANTNAYVLDADMYPVPQGVVGELYLGGDRLAWGYLGWPDLTAERFVPNPFATASSTQNTQLYRTGDRVRQVANGDVVFVGRADRQIKLRGFRIELSEIESALLRVPGVQEAVVSVKDRADGLKYIVAFVGVTDANVTTVTALRAALRACLPEYMVPAAFVVCPRLPITPNGKVDVRALLAMPLSDKETPLVPEGDAALTTQTERWVAEMWADLLMIDQRRMGRYDHFFEQGGHSLIAIRLMARVKEAFAVSMPLNAIFKHALLSEFATAVDEAIALASSALPTEAFGQPILQTLERGTRELDDVLAEFLG